MIYFRNKYQMIKASEVQIREFFSETILKVYFQKKSEVATQNTLRDTYIQLKLMAN